MALSLAVKKGSQIDVGDHRLRVLEVVRGHSIQVEVDGQSYIVTESQTTKVLPEVYLSYGLPYGKDNFAAVRLAIQAPRSIPINRVQEAPA